MDIYAMAVDRIEFTKINITNEVVPMLPSMLSEIVETLQGNLNFYENLLK